MVLVMPFYHYYLYITFFQNGLTTAILDTDFCSGIKNGLVVLKSLVSISFFFFFNVVGLGINPQTHKQVLWLLLNYSF